LQNSQQRTAELTRIEVQGQNANRTRARLELHILPHLERAVVPLEKLSDYVLSPDHPKGKDKARVFKAVLGIERKHAEVLAEIIKESLPRALAVERPQDEHGRSWAT